jgi:hypothetical protein
MSLLFSLCAIADSLFPDRFSFVFCLLSSLLVVLGDNPLLTLIVTFTFLPLPVPLSPLHLSDTAAAAAVAAAVCTHFY